MNIKTGNNINACPGDNAKAKSPALLSPSPVEKQEEPHDKLWKRGVEVLTELLVSQAMGRMGSSGDARGSLQRAPQGRKGRWAGSGRHGAAPVMLAVNGEWKARSRRRFM